MSGRSLASLKSASLGSLIWLALVPALVASGAWAQAGRKALTVERIFAEPSLSGRLPTGLAWSPHGKLLSYVRREGQKAEVWALDVASGERRLLVDSAKLAPLLPSAEKPAAGEAAAKQPPAFALGSYQWSPRGSHLLLVAQGHLYLFDLASGAGKRLTSGKEPVQDPKFSPDGNWVSFVRAYNLHALNLANGKETPLTQDGREELMKGQLDWVYPEELGIHTAYWWSPDSTRIAYLEMDERPVTQFPIVDFLPYRGQLTPERYPKAGDANPIVRVGVMALRDRKTVWMDTGRDTDIYLARVDWLKDAKRLAIQRLNRGQTKLELLLAEAATGRAQVVLTEEDRAWINLHDDLRFLAGRERFLWASERDGFRHLYLYDLSGRQLAQLTRGNWAVTGVAGLDEKNSAIYFTSTRRSPMERHLERASLAGSEPTALTREPGWHSALLSPDAAHFLDTYSNAMAPPRMDLYRTDGSHRQIVEENRVAELADYALSPLEFFQVRGADGAMLDAMMIKPPDFNPAKKYPVLVYVYGGPLGQIVRRGWGGDRFLWHQLLVQRGYIVFGLDNRGMAAPARGHAFETSIHRRFGQLELADQLAGVSYLTSLPYVDPARIGIWGWSYGGYLTCYAMLNAPDVFRAGAAVAPVTDWRDYDTIYTERYMGRPQENPEGYKNSSPVTHAAKLRGKLLVAHGTADDNVHLQNTIQLVDEFIKAGKQFDLMLYPGKSHGIAGREARTHLFQRLTQFLLDNL